MAETQLYRHFDQENRLIYVGISLSTAARLAQHRCNSEWFDKIVKITIERYPDKFTAIAAEIKAIETEKPMFNVSHGNKQRKPQGVIGIYVAARILNIKVHKLQKMVNDGTCPFAVGPKHTWPKPTSPRFYRVILEEYIERTKNAGDAE